MYWQHPHLPWLTLFPRMSKSNIKFTNIGDAEREALALEWSDSFRALFQVNRTNHFDTFSNLFHFFKLSI